MFIRQDTIIHSFKYHAYYVWFIEILLLESKYLEQLLCSCQYLCLDLRDKCFWTLKRHTCGPARPTRLWLAWTDAASIWHWSVLLKPSASWNWRSTLMDWTTITNTSMVQRRVCIVLPCFFVCFFNKKDKLSIHSRHREYESMQIQHLKSLTLRV